MTDVPLLVTPAGPIGRGPFFARCQMIADRLAGAPSAGPLLPLCGGRADFMVAMVAGLVQGRRIVLPNDNGPSALSAVIAEAGTPLVVLGPDDDEPGIDAPIFRMDAGWPDASSAEPEWAAGPALTLYTSGSTGRPTAHHHAPAVFVAGAAAWAERLELGSGPASIVATVPAQHMYGLEASIMLPLVRPGTTAFDGRPFYPADVQAALESVADRRVLVTTPLHLRALVRSGVRLPPLYRIVSATAPLPPDLAGQAENLWGAPVVEVYGSTETGLAATRRPAVSEVFTLRPDFVLETTTDTPVLHGPHFPTPVRVHDRIAPEDDGRFRLLGRGVDLVNVAGKRASLSGLTTQLLSIDGVEDGVVVVPEEDGPNTRPVAVVVAPGLTAAAIREGLRTRLPDVFVPRRIVLVDALPRTATGKLPAAAIADVLRRPAERFTVSADHPSLAGHFPGNPIVPGVVILDRALQAAGLQDVGELRQVKFHSPLKPDETCTVEVTRGRRGATLSCRAGDRTVLSALLPLESS